MENKETLHEQERLVLIALKKGEQDLNSLTKETKLKEDAASHACLWLEAKKLVSINQEKEEFVELNEEGLEYAEKGLPERQALEIAKNGTSVEQLKKELGPKSGIAISWLMKKKWARINNGQIELTEKGLQATKKKTREEQLIQLLKEKRKLSKGYLKEIMKIQKNGKEKHPYLEITKKRKEIFKESEKTNRKIKLTQKGKKLADSGLETEKTVNVLTSQMIKSKKWKKMKFRPYNITAEVPPLQIGKKQPYLELLDEAREYLASLGFEEIRYPITETEFWNFDALYQPQFHPARTERDTYYLKEPRTGQIPKEYAERIRQTHENGGDTKSKGWNYKWNQEKARRLLMRTHTTAATVRVMQEKDKVPAKYFTIARNFRRDVIDATHLPEFFQCEGIIIQENMTFRELLGTLKEFASVFAGTDKVKFKPAYFPYTEPSVELFAEHKQLGEIELGGAGMFRPEVRLPAGVKEEVMAWGLGFDRLCMLKLGLKDIRELFSKNIKWLEESPMRMM